MKKYGVIQKYKGEDKVELSLELTAEMEEKYLDMLEKKGYYKEETKDYDMYIDLFSSKKAGNEFINTFMK